jgi:hypothetical protein
MEPKNPYAPPVETSELYEAPQEPGGLSISGPGWTIVTGMAQWMKIVSTFLYIAAALFGVGSLFSLVAGATSLAGPSSMRGAAAATGGIMAGVTLLMSILFLLAATWLRRSATHFYEGVLSNAERPLANGFRNLRLYLILYGLYSILVLVVQILQVVEFAKLSGKLG